jgi:cytochrome c-type biogenesis protein CcmH/NrfG
MLGQYQAAAEQFERAYALDPSEPDSLKALATSLFMQGRVAEAANVLQEVVRSWPDDAAAHAKLDRVLAALDKQKH